MPIAPPLPLSSLSLPRPRHGVASPPSRLESLTATSMDDETARPSASMPSNGSVAPGAVPSGTRTCTTARDATPPASPSAASSHPQFRQHSGAAAVASEAAGRPAPHCEQTAAANGCSGAPQYAQTVSPAAGAVPHCAQQWWSPAPPPRRARAAGWLAAATLSLVTRRYGVSPREATTQ